METTTDCLLRDCYSVSRLGYCKTRKNNKHFKIVKVAI